MQDLPESKFQTNLHIETEELLISLHSRAGASSWSQLLTISHGLCAKVLESCYERNGRALRNFFERIQQGAGQKRIRTRLSSWLSTVEPRTSKRESHTREAWKP